MNDRILNILSMCLQAKEKGHDVFFNYSPHVDTISVNVYKNGWKTAIFDELGNVLKSYEDAKIEAHISANKTWDVEEIDAQISVIEAYLKELIAS